MTSNMHLQAMCGVIKLLNDFCCLLLRVFQIEFGFHQQLVGFAQLCSSAK